MTLDPLALHGLPVLVTGASSGIGRETAILLSELGARVVLAGRDQQRLEETRSRLRGEGHALEAFDLAESLDALPAWIKGIAGRMGPLHGLVHCAGVFQFLPLQMCTAPRLEAMFRVNVMSAILLVKGFRQQGCAAPGGSVVLMSSAAGIAGQPGISVYSASKAALIGFMRSAALELAPQKLRINCVAPGVVESEMSVRSREALTPEQFQAIEERHPLGLGTTRDVACAAAYLLAKTGRWITGTTLILDGGFTATQRM